MIGGLHAAGLRVAGCDIYPAEWLALAGEVDSFHQAPLARDAAYRDFICKLVEDEGARYVMPLTDVEVDVLNEQRERLREVGAVLCLSPENTVRICRDKMALFDFIESRALPIRTIPTRRARDVIDAGGPDALPVIAKPARGRSSEGLAKLDSGADWERFASREDLEGYVVQPMVKGHVCTVDVVRDPISGAVVSVPREELLRTLNGAGTSVRVFADADLASSCEALADALGVCGCVNFEFICDEQGVFHFVECNPRFAGGVKFSCLAAYDCVLNHLRCFTGDPIEGLHPYRERYIARKYQEATTRIL